MKNILKRMIEEFQRRNLPEMTGRDVHYPMLSGKATVITGMRRTGKTSLCIHKMQEIVADGVDKTRILYLNFEDDRLLNFKLEDCQTILDVYYSLYPENREKLCYFFFDEMQNVKDWERFIRRLIDVENVQIALTGSSSKLLTTEIATSMRGRSIKTEVLPFSFEEYMRYHKTFEQIPKNFCDADIAKLRNALSRYFRIGGFPEIYRYDELEHYTILQEYIDLVILRDVIDRHAVTNLPAIRQLVNSLFNSAAQKFSVIKFANTLNKSLGIKCSKNDIYSFMDYLEEAYIIFRIPIHSMSVRVRQVNPNKVYLIDIGMVRVMIENPDGDKGALLENLVFLHLRRQGWTLEYYNTSNGYEIDFYAYHHKTKEKMLVQVSYSLNDEKTFQREVRALTQGGEELKVAKRLIVTWDDEKELDDGIHIVPAWRFLLNR